MKNNPLDDIVRCNVEISSPASSDASFNSILLIVPGPKVVGEKTMDKVTAISRADALEDYGFSTEDTAYLAAMVAFSQNPSPDKLYICIRQGKESEIDGESTTVYEDMAAVLSRASKEAEFYGIHITDFREAADVQAAIAWAEAKEKLDRKSVV